MTRTVLSTAVLISALLFPSSAPAQERGPRTPPPVADTSAKIIRSMSTAEIEELLKEMRVEFKKANSPTEKDVLFYDFKKNNYEVRLTYFGGKDVMLDVIFNEAPLDTVNNWNRRARFTRAVVYEDNKGKYISLESNFDFLGGVTLENVKHFFKTFDAEAHDFENFIQNAGGKAGGKAGAGGATGKEDTIYKTLTNEKFEKLLADLGINYRKTDAKDKTIYTYSVAGQAVRVINFAGKDIMADSAFKKLTLEQINKYNYDNKFVRIVSYRDNQGDFTSLEMNLDCEGGMTDTILRNFITFFEDNVRAFTKFANTAN